jgi:protein-S-isoprenylcysteine O-methyltransferase Ste14
MSDESVIRWVLLGCFATGMTISATYRLRARRSGDVIARKREGAAFIAKRVVFTLPLMLALLAWLINPAWLAWSVLPLPQAVRWVGVALAVLMVPVGWWVFHTIGENISETVLTKRNHQLVTRGPYRWVRHPFYASGLLFMTSFALASASWLVMLLMVPAVAFWWVAVIPREEAALIEKFGDRYREYRRHTGQVLPMTLSGARSGG